MNSDLINLLDFETRRAAGRSSIANTLGFDVLSGNDGRRAAAGSAGADVTGLLDRVSVRGGQEQGNSCQDGEVGGAACHGLNMDE